MWAFSVDHSEGYPQTSSAHQVPARPCGDNGKYTSDVERSRSYLRNDRRFVGTPFYTTATGKKTTTMLDIRPQLPRASGSMGDPTTESPSVQKLIRSLELKPHIEGGYFAETDRDEQKVALTSKEDVRAVQSDGSASPDNKRHLSTSIFYCLTPRSPIGAFHRNRSKTVHNLHRGRGMYVTLTPKDDGVDIDTFAVGHDVAKGEKLQWVVDGGSYKASFLLPDDDDPSSSVLLISEVCHLRITPETRMLANLPRRSFRVSTSTIMIFSAEMPFVTWSEEQSLSNSRRCFGRIFLTSSILVNGK